MSRYSENVNGNELEKGDRIAKELVARTKGQYGQQIDPHRDSPITQLITATDINRMEDVHTAILVDPETQTIIRAGRHSSSSAWSQKEEDWKVYETGSSINVIDATVEERPENERDESHEEYMQAWIDILFDEFKHGNFDLNDERRLNVRTLHLYDPYDVRKGYATIELTE